MTRKQGTSRLLWVTIVLAVLITYSYHNVDWALRAQAKHVPDPDEVVSVEGQPMSAWDAARNYLFPRIYSSAKLGVVKHWLLYRHQTRLWLFLFSLNALLGWCASIWLMMIGGRALGPRVPRLLLALLAGPLSYFLVKALPSWDLFGVGQALPLLAGLFVTTFYENLHGLLDAFFDALKRKLGGKGGGASADAGPRASKAGTTAGMLFCLLIGWPSSALAQEQASSYFVCSDPKKPPCWAFSERGKAKCRSCVEWMEVFPETRVRELLALLDNNYRARANAFLDDAAQAVFGRGLPATRSGNPIKTTQLYRTPEDFGFEEIHAVDAAAGTLVVFPDHGGVLLEVASDEGREQAVLYPSARASGDLVVTRSIESLGEPKYLIPIDAAAELPEQ